MWPRAFKILGVVGVAGAGLRYYCKGGVNTYKPDLEGKIVIVTGGNAGIGKETARRLNQLKAKVIILGRDTDKANDFIEDVYLENKQNNRRTRKIRFYKVDFTNLEELKKFADDFSNQYERLDILINNAGANFPELSRTAKGQEKTMAVNHLAPCYLTHLLMPMLKDTPESRVINVSSRAHYRDDGFGTLVPNMADYFFDKVVPETYRYRLAYNTSKLANVLFAKGLASYLEKNKLNIKTCSLHPGVVRSEFWRDMPLVVKAFSYLGYPLLWTLTKSEHEGAETTLHCSLMPFKELKNGAYYSDCAIKEPSIHSTNSDNIAQSWQITNQRLKEITGDRTIFDQ
jgi:retinol dehydrogenase 12